MQASSGRYDHCNRLSVRFFPFSETTPEFGMPPKLASCHTAKIDDYVIEGHVPAREIQRLLKERPKALGLSVPGMPLGSPGMDGEAFDHKTEPYNVLLVLHNGATSVFQSY